MSTNSELNTYTECQEGAQAKRRANHELRVQIALLLQLIFPPPLASAIGLVGERG
jgi:hypothetical protein